MIKGAADMLDDDDEAAWSAKRDAQSMGEILVEVSTHVEALEEARQSEAGAIVLGVCEPEDGDVAFGVLATAMAVAGPLTVLRRWLQRFAIWAVLASTAYLTWYALTRFDLGARFFTLVADQRSTTGAEVSISPRFAIRT